MKTILMDYKKPTSRFDNLSLCLGYFDGVHIGHQSLIDFARKHAKYDLGLLTFDKPISSLIETGKSQELLTSLDDRFKVISKFGIDYYFVLQIDKHFTELSDMEFIEMLQKMNVKEIYVGKDFRYGKNASGTIYTLQDYFDVKVIDIKNVKGEKISTQRIVSLLKEGELKTANKLLGHNYTMTGSVKEGNRVGRTIGFPTLNLNPICNYVLPKFGVYYTICYLDGIPHIGITNVGQKPTVSSKSEVTVETHLVNYKVDQNPSQLSIEFLDFLRPEMKFESLDELKKQIEKDIQKVI